MKVQRKDIIKNLEDANIDFINNLEKAKQILINKNIEYNQHIEHNKESIKTIEQNQENYLNGFVQGADDICKKLRLKIEKCQSEDRKSIDIPYSSPDYINQAYMQPSVFVDPMGSSQTIYERIPVFKNNRNTSDYTFDQDQMEFREDLIAKQSEIMNKNDYGTYNLYKNR